MRVPSHSNLLFNAGMENKEVRRQNLLMLAKQHGSLRALGDAVEVPPAYLSQLKNRANGRTMGDDLARRIEAKLEKPLGWMDAPQWKMSEEDVAQAVREATVPYTVEAEEQVLLRLWSKLSGPQKAKVLETLTEQVNENVALVRELAPKLDTADTLHRRTIQGGEIPPLVDDHGGKNERNKR